MRHATIIAIIAAVLAPAPAELRQAVEGWRQWRGPFNTGMARGDAPLKWDDRTGIQWKVEIPGRGHSTPVLAGDRLFLTTAVPTGRRTAPEGRGRAGGGADAGLEHRFEVIAVDRPTGTIAWQRKSQVWARTPSPSPCSTVTWCSR